MAKITRYTGNLLAFAANATGTNRTVFGALTQSDTLDNNVNADFLTGWEIVGVNENPTREDFNAMGFTLGQLIAYLHQWGVAEWDSLQEYNDGSITNVGGILYESQVDANIGNDPTTDNGTNWRQLDDNSITLATITPASDANVTLTAAQYNADVLVLQDGSWTAGHNIIVPDQARLYWIDNSAGSYTALVTTSGGVGVSVTAGTKRPVVCDGTNVVNPVTISELPPSYISGGIASNNVTDANNDLDITAGAFRDSTDSINLRPAAVTRQLDVAFGTGNGGLSSSLTPAINTEYWIHAVRRADNVDDYAFDTSITATNLVTDHSITAYRPVGWFYTDGAGSILGMVVTEEGGGGIYHQWKAPTLDINLANTLGNTPRNDAIKVPTGVKVRADINVRVADAAGTVHFYIYDPDIGDTVITPSTSASPLMTGVSQTTSSFMEKISGMMTDTSRQLRAVCANVTTADEYKLVTLGFTWSRR